MTPEQLVALKAAILADTDQAVIDARATRNDTELARLYNAPTVPAFILWKTAVPKNEVGKAFQATALAAITAGNNDKLANFAAWNDTVNPSRSDQRAFFDDVFSVAAGASTRTALLALWKRTANKTEKLFATGAGSDASPATPSFEGSVTVADIGEAMNG